MTSLTLIIPVRGRLPLMLKTLRSIDGQVRYPDRLIIVDNGSDDSAHAALCQEAEHLNSRLPVSVIRCTATGAPAARNAGLQLADTEWTMFFDSDDIMLPSHIAGALECAEANPDADIVGWDAVFVDSNGKQLKVKTFPQSDYLFHAIMHGSLGTQCYMARTELFRRTGEWNNEAKIWNDLEISVRMLALRPQIVKRHSSAPSVRILTHSDSITGADFSSRAADRDHTLTLLTRFAETAQAKAICKRLVPILALKRAILAGCCRREGAKDTAMSLYHAALSMPVATLQRLALRFSYHHTALSLPAAARIVRFLF